MDYQLVSDYKPAGDQPEAIKQLSEGIARGDRSQVLLGVTGSGKTFTIGNVMPGEFRLRVTGLPPDAYVKNAKLGSIDILNQPLAFKGSAEATLEIDLGAKGGRIDGTISSDGRQPFQNTQVVLVPDQHRDRVELFKAVTADSTGRFSIRGIAPGDYKVFAWTGLAPFGYFDPDVLKSAENSAVRVRVSDGDTMKVSVTPIPAQM